MKIGLVTWIGIGNYGTVLQSFALHKKLSMLGYDVFIICGFRKLGVLGAMAKLLLRETGILDLRMKARFKSTQPLSSNKFYRFVKSNYNIATPVFTKELVNIVNTTDVFLAGSDQIWNVRHLFDPFMFLDFAANKKKISYASSIGISDIPQKYRTKIKELLGGFSHIGVREKTAVNVLGKITGRKDITQVLDPTFLLTAEDWANVCKESKYEIKLPDKFILCYLIGKGKDNEKMISEIIEQAGIENVIVVPAGENPGISINGASIYRYAGPAEFVDLIRQADLVCTDSFHATALSINLSKDFVELLRFKDGDAASQNSRIYDLLDQYGLRGRLYTGDGNVPAGKIDYAPIQEKLKTDRGRSLKFLADSIER